MVNPGSREVYMQAMREGLIDIIMQAGAQVGITGCGPCSGCHQGMLAPAENFHHQCEPEFSVPLGSPEANIYVASSATVGGISDRGAKSCRRLMSWLMKVWRIEEVACAYQGPRLDIRTQRQHRSHLPEDVVSADL